MNERGAAHAALVLILLLALALRLHNIGFGLPSMYDPDEPIFMITALKMPLEGTLNPGWFGHPGSTTIYLLALIDGAVVAAGLLSGAYANVPAFTKAAYANPALLFIPSRVAMALIGVVCIWLTYLVAKRLHGTAAGLIAAAFLAINSLHIAWSQVVRTDIQASAFMLGCILFSIRAAESGRLKDFLIAGAFVGFAIATKWPAATVFAAVAGASLYRAIGKADTLGRQARNFTLASLAVVTGLFLASPFIFLDWRTVLANVSHEMTEGHLAHTGGSFLDNLAWYLRYQVAGSMGLIGLLLVLAGTAISALRFPLSRFTLILPTLAFLALICAQHLIWSRWVLPVMPMLCMFAAVALVTLARLLEARMDLRRRRILVAGLAGLCASPSLSGAIVQSRERSNDTREQAARWAAANIPPGSSVVFEHLELSLRHQPWKILFPLGEVGCIDGVEALKTGVHYDNVEKLRNHSPIVDLGNVNPARIDSCRADYAILTYYDLYLAEAKRYPKEIRTYNHLLAGGHTIKLFAPAPGRAGGPMVRVVAMPQH